MIRQTRGSAWSGALRLLAGAGLLAASTSAFAADMPLKAPPPPVYQPGGYVYVGVGGGYSSVRFEQDIFAVGISQAFAGGTLVANGIAQGPGDGVRNIQSTFAGEVQAGFMRHFDSGGISTSPWLWGGKFKYKYLGTSATETGVIVPQTGAFTPTGGGAATPLTGNVLIQSMQTTVEHELSALVIFGQSLNTGMMVYAGAGPAALSTKSFINRAVGFGDVNGAPTAITGAPVSFASATWMWGAAAQIGLTYTVAPCWMLDFNYTITATKKFDINYAAPFTSTSAGITYVGNAYITTPQHLTTQAIAVTINRVF